MLHLHYGNRLEDLLAPLAESVREQQARDQLEPVTIVVPNRVTEQFLKFRLAERLGVAANIRCPFFRSFLTELVESASKGARVLDADSLALLMLDLLRSPAAAADAALAPVLAYVRQPPAARDRE